MKPVYWGYFFILVFKNSFIVLTDLGMIYFYKLQ
jgi:hypothetical protein